MRRINLDREWLEDQYLIKKKGCTKIAKEVDVNYVTILNRLREYQIPIRSKMEAFRLLSNHVSLTSKAVEFLNGLLLGDGHLGILNEWSAAYKASSKYKSFLEYLSKEFVLRGIQQAGRISRDTRWHLFPNGRSKYCVSFDYISRYYVELRALWSQWYVRDGVTKKGNPKYRKVVPSSLQLTPAACLQWYIGDGTFSREICLCTDGFTYDEVQLLVEKVKSLGFPATYMKTSNRIRLPRRSAASFLDYIGPCPVSCYAYKWSLN